MCIKFMKKIYSSICRLIIYQSFCVHFMGFILTCATLRHLSSQTKPLWCIPWLYFNMIRIGLFKFVFIQMKNNVNYNAWITIFETHRVFYCGNAFDLHSFIPDLYSIQVGRSLVVFCCIYIRPFPYKPT